MTTTIVALDLETTGLDPDRHHIWEIGAVVRDHRDPTYDGRWQIIVRPNLSMADPAALAVGRYYERAPQYVGHHSPATTKVLGVALVPDAYVVQCPQRTHDAGDDSGPVPLGPTGRRAVAATLAVILDGATILGVNPQFDAAFVARFLRAHGNAPTWHHRLVDVASLTAGYLAGMRAGYNASAAWLADAHNAHPDAAGCRVPAPELDTTPTPTPRWAPVDLAQRIDIPAPPPEAAHTALGDATWALSIYDAVLGGDRD